MAEQPLKIQKLAYIAMQHNENSPSRVYPTWANLYAELGCEAAA